MAARRIYQEVQEIVRTFVGPGVPVLNMDLNEIHVTIANDDIAPGEKITLTLEDWSREIAEDSQGIKTF